MGNYEVKSVFHLGHYFLLAISPIAYQITRLFLTEYMILIEIRAVTPDGTVYDRLTGGVLKASEHPSTQFLGFLFNPHRIVVIQRMLKLGQKTVGF